MATVTGFTAEKMEEIANATIVGASVSGGHLILHTAGGSDIDAGVVSGTVGPAGPGFPTGGSSGQVLAKNSPTNYDASWKTLIPVGTVPPSSPANGDLWVDTA